eukprot:746964-Hanusia_phi.AAC.1
MEGWGWDDELQLVHDSKQRQGGGQILWYVGASRVLAPECQGYLVLVLHASHAKLAHAKLCSGNDSPKQETVVSRTSRLTYFFLFLVVVLATWIFRDNAPDTFTGNDIFSKNLNCPSNTKLNGCVARSLALSIDSSVPEWNFKDHSVHRMGVSVERGLDRKGVV